MVEKFKPPRGFRDFPPEVAILRREVISRVVKVFERYGFDPLDTPSVEHWETLAGKYGEEAENRLIWKFTDPWSGREYALRYDLTVPLARFIAGRPDIGLPFKRYHIGPVWRHEEPQRGRYREFYQCDADTVGSPYPEADAEIINLTVDALRELGFTEFNVKLNDRRLLAGIFEEELGLDNPLRVYRIIDKLDKIGLEGVMRELSKTGLSDSLVGRIAEIISHRGEPLEELGSLCAKYGKNPKVSEACKHLEEVVELLNDTSVVELDMSLVRGLDYYTGPIVEVVLKKPSIGSVAGGGRYDNLIELFTGKRIPATGVSLGIERLIDAGIELGIYSVSRKTVTQVQVIVLDWSLLKHAWATVKTLRDAGVNTRIDVARANEDSQRRKARKLGIPLLVYIGAEEVENKTKTIYDTRTGERKVVPQEELVKTVKEMLAKAP